jgi:hypothetical protein
MTIHSVRRTSTGLFPGPAIDAGARQKPQRATSPGTLTPYNWRGSYHDGKLEDEAWR